MDNGTLLSYLSKDQLYDSSAEDPDNDLEVQGIITPEEMAIADEHTSPKIRQLLTVIKWAAAKRTEEVHNVEKSSKSYLPSSDSIDRVMKTCQAKGNGLLMGLVGKRCKFHIFADANGLLDLQIEIRGPNNEICSEKIMSLFPTRRMSRLLNPVDLEQVSKKQTLTQYNGDVKYIEDSKGNTYIRQKSVEILDDNDCQKIPFDYQCVGEGKYLVSYVPRSTGKHHISVFWQAHHINGSPFIAKIAESAVHLEKQFSLESQKRMLAQRGKSTDSLDTFNGERSVSTDTISCNNSPNFADVGQIAAPAKLTKQGTVTRRRVLRRVITKGGKDIIINEVGPSPSVSRQNSVTKSPGISRQNSIDYVTNTEFNNHQNTPDTTHREQSTRVIEPKETLPHRSAFVHSPKAIHPVSELSDIDNVSGKTKDFVNNIVDKALQSAMHALTDKHCRRQACLDLGDCHDVFSDHTSHVNINTNQQLNTSTSRNAGKIFVHQGLVECEPTSGNVTNNENKRAKSNLEEINQNKEDCVSVKTSQINQNKEDCGSVKTAQINKNKEEKLNIQIVTPAKAKSPLDSPQLKVLQSDSLNKVCYFVSQRAITHSMSALQSQASGQTNSFEELRAINDENQPDKMMSMASVEENKPDAPVNPKNVVSLSSKSSHSSRRSSLKRQDVAVCRKGSVESSSDSDKLLPTFIRSNSTTKKIPRASKFNENKMIINTSPESQYHIDSEQTNLEESRNVEKSTQNTQPQPQTWFSSQIHIRIPTAKTDKWSQVSYDEIKLATGWRSPMTNIRQRKTYTVIHNQVDITIDKSGSISDPTPVNNSCQRHRSPPSMWYGDNVPRIVYDPPVDRAGPADDENGHYDVQQWLQDNQMMELRPVRQSTVETIDSGIVDSRCSSPGKQWRAQQNLPNPNGHRLLCRHPYKGQIELDPRLLRSASNSPSGDEDKENCTPGSRNRPSSRHVKQVSHNRVIRTSSDGKKTKASLLVREDSCSLSDTELNKAMLLDKRKSFHRPKFTRRSSSRSSKASRSNLVNSDHRKHLVPHEQKRASETFEVANDSKMSASQSRKIKFRRRSFALDDSPRHGSVDTSNDDTANILAPKESSPVFTSDDELCKLTYSCKGLTSSVEEKRRDVALRRKSYGGSSTPKRKLIFQRSSTLNEDSYCGFGLSQSHRDDLLSQINIFSNLHEKTDVAESNNDMYAERRSDGTLPDSDNHTFGGLYYVSSSHPMPFNDFSDAYGDASVSDTDGVLDYWKPPVHCEMCETLCSHGVTVVNPAREFLDLIVMMEQEKDKEAEGGLGESDWADPQPGNSFPSRCRAVGAGLQTGIVETPVNFQVVVDGAGDGNLTVGINGPRPFTVRETSVTYTGDNLYDVIYYVTQPGYYVIDVKWSDTSIPNSPFIAKVIL